MEQWRDIIGYEGLYQVSNLGRVKSFCNGKERILVGCKDRDGYLRVGLYKDGKMKMCKVHRLVAEAFIPNPYGLPEVNHRNEDKQSNIVTNLEWCTRSYNNSYGTGHERRAKAQSKPVYQYTLNGSLVRSYPSAREAERRTGYANSAISMCCNGKRKQHMGFIWSYKLVVPKGRLF